MSAKVAPETEATQAVEPNDPFSDFGASVEPKHELEAPHGKPPGLPVLTKKQSGLFQFSNTEAIKQKVRDNKIRGKEYNVHDFYHETGFFQKIAKDSKFENLTLGIICVNALWISIDTDSNTADTILDAKPVFVAADVLFFAYFSIELFIRFMAFKKKCSCTKDGWFVFDSTLVFLYAFDPFTVGLMAYASGGGGLDLPTAVLRLFRLARLSRLVRMLRSLPELMIMIKGMVSAAASVGYTLGLLMLITYIFAIALRNLVPKAEDYVEPDMEQIIYQNPDRMPIETEFFSSVPEAMHNLIIYAVFLDYLSLFIINVKEQSTPCFIICWMFIALASMTVMNMLIGVLCEVISAVAVEEKESMMVDKVNEKFGEIVQELDKNNDGDLSYEEFTQLLDYPQALAALESVNVDPESMIDLAEDFFFEDGEPVKVSFPEFMDMVLDLRGGQPATVKDIMGLGKRVNRKVMKFKGQLETMEVKVSGIDDKVDSLGKLVIPSR